MEYIKNKEAIAIVKQMVVDGQISQDVAEKYFPELKESEDEKIRKRLIELVKQSSDLLYPPNQKSMLAWLEKQGEKEKFIKKELGCIRGYREEAIRRLHELEKKGEQKPVEWSKEDSMQMYDCINKLSTHPHIAQRDKDMSVSWLKSLRPKYWKPSEEQMEALKNCCNGLEDDSNGILDSLYNDLKAL